MPISLDYTWEETEATVTVDVSVKGISRSKLDVSATYAFVKVNAPPHFLLIDLLKDVDDTKSSATIDNGMVSFRCVKKEKGIWGKLKAEGDKEAIKERRDTSVEVSREAAIAAQAKKKEMKLRLDKDAVGRQMDLEQAKRDLIQQRKDDELATERAKLDAWEASVGNRERGGTGGDFPDEDDNDSDADEEEVAAARAAAEEEAAQKAAPKALPAPPPAPGAARPTPAGKCLLPDTLPAEVAAEAMKQLPDIDSDLDSSDSEQEDEQRADIYESSDSEEEEEEVRGAMIEELPPPRSRQEPVIANFTELHGKWLPARAPREAEFAELKQKALDEKALEDSLDVSERHPVFLKDKGDSLYKQGDYRGAVNAYSRAIDMDARNAICYANRAACHLKTGNLDRCIQDCSEAIALYSELHSRVAPAEGLTEEDGRVWRRKMVKVMVRRGGAYCEKGDMVESIRDYEAAWKLEPENEDIARDLDELRAAMQPADAALLRRRGDARFQAKDYDGAVEAYTMLLGDGEGEQSSKGGAGGAEGERLACYSNRAACHLVMGSHAAALADCNSGLGVLLEGTPEAAVDGAAEGGEAGGAACAWARRVAGGEGGEGWGAGGDKSASLMRLLARRASVESHLKRCAEAAGDMRAAAAVARAGGDASRAEKLEDDAQKMLQLGGAKPVAAG